MTDIQETLRVRNALRKTIEAVKEENQPLMADILTKVVIDALNKFQTKVNVGLQDSVSDLLDQFKRDIERQIFDIAQQWTLATRQEKFLFPRNCRFVYSKGSSTIVVIEQEPGRRTLTMDEGLLGIGTGAKTGRTVRKSILLPYVIFVMQWRQGLLVNAYTAWAKSPMRSLSDPVYNPILPNTHDNYNICTGDLIMPNGDISLGCERVISDYWQSEFNTDLANFWWDKVNLAPIRDVDTWEENSDDPFLFNDLNLGSKNKTVEDMIDFCLNAETDPESADLRHRLTAKIEEVSGQMFDKVMKYFKKRKIERLYPNDVEDALAKSLEDVLDEVCSIVIAMQNEVESLTAELTKDRKDIDHYGWEKRSDYWSQS